MKINLSVWTLAVPALACLWSLAAAKSELPVESLDSTLQLACVYNGHSLILMRGDGANRAELVKTDGDIISPSWSPDGRKIAFFEVGGHGLPVLSEFKIRLCCLDMDTKKVDTLGEADSHIERRGDDDKYVVQKPPFWLDNTRMIFLDRKGVHLVDLTTSGSKTVVPSDDIRDCAILAPSNNILVSQGKNLVVYDPVNGDSTGLFAENETGLPKKDIDRLAVSPSGTTIALGGWDRLYLVDSSQRKIIREAKLPDPVRDLIWDANGRTVICLTGNDSKRIGSPGAANPTGASTGSFQISTLTESDEKPTVLYKKFRFDAGRTNISLSTDGRWLLMISNGLNEYRPYLYVLSTGGAGIRKLAKDGEYTDPIWRP